VNFFDYIRSWFIWATNVLVRAAMDCYNSPLLPDFLGDIFSDLSDWTSEIAGWLWDAGNWYDYVEDWLAEILPWLDIKQMIRSWLYGIESLVSWFSNWYSTVLQLVNSWWTGTIATVQGWISVAVQPFNSMLIAWTDFWNNLWPEIVSTVSSVSAAWDNFWNYTFPTLVSFAWLTSWWNARVQDVQGLINSAFTIRESLWSGWQELRDQVFEFFADPWQWLYDRFSDWFLGPEG